MDNRRQLKIKIKSLAAESRIIRREECRLHSPIRKWRARKPRGDRSKLTPAERAGLDEVLAADPKPAQLPESYHRANIAEQRELWLHRTKVVGPAARHALLAYAFIRGRTAATVEPPGSPQHGWRKPIDWSEIERLVERYGAKWDATRENQTEFEARQRGQAKALAVWRRDFERLTQLKSVGNV